MKYKMLCTSEMGIKPIKDRGLCNRGNATWKMAATSVLCGFWNCAAEGEGTYLSCLGN